MAKVIYKWDAICLACGKNIKQCKCHRILLDDFNNTGKEKLDILYEKNNYNDKLSDGFAMLEDEDITS